LGDRFVEAPVESSDGQLAEVREHQREVRVVERRQQCEPRFADATEGREPNPALAGNPLTWHAPRMVVSITPSIEMPYTASSAKVRSAAG
jgi:hypothetical protein